MVRFEDLEKVKGTLVHVQVEQVGGRMQIRCRLKTDESSDPDSFFNYADDEGAPVAFRQLDLLRDALVSGLRVRLMYEPSSGTWKRFYDVRLYAPNLCPKRFPITVNGDTRYLPYCSSHNIDIANNSIRRVVFAIHGANSRVASDYLNATQHAASMFSRRVLNETLIIAPQFINYSEYTDGEIDGTIPNDVLLWNGWRFVGGRSDSRNATGATQPFQISSFAVIDEMLRHIINHGNFPNLRRIVILGQSGGGQFVNRFAASSRFEPLLALPAGITVRYIVMNPGSYMYFSDKRVKPRSQRPRYEFDFEFETPSDLTIDEAIAFCASLTSNDCGSRDQCRNQYNRYGWGTEDLLDYHRNLSLSAEEMAEQYCNRNVIYLVGSEDRIIGSDIRHTGLSCGDILQGKDRLERAVICFAHLKAHMKNELGCSIERRHTIDIVPGVGHGGRPMITSKLGRKYIFE